MTAEFLYHNFGLKLYTDCYVNLVNKLNLRNDFREMRYIICHIKCQIRQQTACTTLTCVSQALNIANTVLLSTRQGFANVSLRSSQLALELNIEYTGVGKNDTRLAATELNRNRWTIQSQITYIMPDSGYELIVVRKMINARMI